MDDPLSKVTLKSSLLIPIRLSFDVRTATGEIKVSFRNSPKSNEEWYASYESAVYGSGMSSLNGVYGGADATPHAIAEVLCTALGAPPPQSIENVERYAVDLTVPDFIRCAAVRPNHPKENPRIERREVCVVFADLREFSTWSMNVGLNDVAEVFDWISDCVLQMAGDYRFDYWKLLGDGIMLVWETPDGGNLRADVALDAVYKLQTKYSFFREDASIDLPVGFGAAVTGGLVAKYVSTNWLESLLVVDYLGPIVNLAARLQGIVEAGKVLVNKRVERLCTSRLYTFEAVSKNVMQKIESKKGIPKSEKEIYWVTQRT